MDKVKAPPWGAEVEIWNFTYTDKDDVIQVLSGPFVTMVALLMAFELEEVKSIDIRRKE